MSLALLVDVGGGQGGEGRIVILVGALMTVPLLLAAREQFQEASDGGWWLPLLCAAACAGWCFLSWRQCRRQPPTRLQAGEDGLLRLASLDSGEAVDAAFVRGWRLGPVLWLHLRPITKVDPAAPGADRRQSASGKRDCRFLLFRRSVDEIGWHALCRWLVWHGRSRHHDAVA